MQKIYIRGKAPHFATSYVWENKETAKLCPNCHREYHIHLGTENLRNKDMAFHFYTFWKWLSGLIVIFALLFWWLKW